MAHDATAGYVGPAMDREPSDSSLLFSANTPAPMPTSPDLRSNSGTRAARSNSTKRDRRISRNARPPNTADGADSHLPPLPTFSRSTHAQEDSVLDIHDPSGGARSAPSNASSSTQPHSDPRRRFSPSSKGNRETAATHLPLPLFLEAEPSRAVSSPSTPPRSNHVELSRPINRAHSMRESTQTSNEHGTSFSNDRQPWHLPSHHAGPSSPLTRTSRRLASPSASMSLLATNVPAGVDATGANRSSWSRNARRWSSSLPRGRESAAFAIRLAENASPYLRAGLEELRSIFDVDSNPIPNSPFVDDQDEEEHARRSGSEDEEGGAPLSRQTSSMLSTEGGASRTLTSSPSALSSREGSPSRSSVALRRTSSDEKKDDALRRRSGENRLSSFFTRQRGEFDLPDARPPYVNHRFLAWSLSVIAVGMTVMCAWGYAMQSDTFSVTLIGFFLTQPAFALAALVALLLRKRAWMDLFSRAIRAHVLAQALIVLLAYLDLSASSLYVRSTVDADDASTESVLRSRFRMVPTMEMRFGPLRGAFEAGDAPDVIAASSSSLLRSSSASNDAIGQLTSGSIHAHDSAVGDWRSRVTHLIVFVVQAAVPIVMILVGQYIVAQRLAWLARQGSLSRQSSMRQQQQQQQDGKVSPSEKASSNYVPGAGLHRPLPRLQIPHSQTQERRTLPPMLRMPGEGHATTIAGAGGTLPRFRRDDHRRRRLATAPGDRGSEHADDPEFVDRTALSPLPSENLMSTAAATTTTTTAAATFGQGTSVHRHNRSVSQPVNLASITLPPQSSQDTSTARLGMTFEDDSPGDHSNMRQAHPPPSAATATSALAA